MTRALPPDGDLDRGTGQGSALARGLAVLTALNDLETATVSGLVAETGLAKPTLIRILQTLMAEGFAARDEATTTYRVTEKVGSLSRALIGRNRHDETVQRVLDELADTLKWPTEFLVPDGDSMVIHLNNRERAPIRLRLFERRRFPLLESASGFAYLAALPKAELRAHLARMAPEEERIARTEIEAVRQRGYGLRRFPALSENMRVVSVVVPGPIGALSLVHFDDVVTIATLDDILLPELKSAAASIAAAK